jgi:glucose-6-phosphate isomerase
VRCHYLANIDGSEFHELTQKLRAETTLFIVSSKSFNTLETLKNAQAARAWYLAQGGSEAELYRHFIAVSSNNAAAVAFGIREENIFPMWDWVGGRYSLWSAIGLPIALAIGMSNFKELLSGAYTMDQHFQTAPFEQNMPVLLACSACGTATSGARKATRSCRTTTTCATSPSTCNSWTWNPTARACVRTAPRCRPIPAR